MVAHSDRGRIHGRGVDAIADKTSPALSTRIGFDDVHFRTTLADLVEQPEGRLRALPPAELCFHPAVTEGLEELAIGVNSAVKEMPGTVELR